MIISFDLDDTLIPATKRFETEKQNLFQRVCAIEELRIGTIQLMKTLQAQGHRIFVYTTSLRKTNKIWFTFFSYNIKLDKVINQAIHERTLREKYSTYSKYPPAFNIDIHIDDSRGVEAEGSRFGFKTIIVAADDTNWTEFVLQNILAHTIT
ncbi:MAG TPA: hypothetical protein PLA68_03285 [Panacibacter sp.]|nr:hypothetical protein [Panacibacter sp.]